jgi:ABC-type uncharacterized transport system permease subunit
MQSTLFGLSAMISLIPACVVGLRRDSGRDLVFWLVLAVAMAGPMAWVLAQTGGSWRAGFATSLWITIAASVGVFAMVAAFSSRAWRLLGLFSPYVLVLAILATLWPQPEQAPFASEAATGWVHAHILVSVATYALVTVAGIAALAAFLQEKALKKKKPMTWAGRLPPVADCESLVLRLLGLAEVVLAIGLLTGMAIQLSETATLFVLEHKTVLAIAAFVVIGGLLLAHRISGVRGRSAARLVLIAYLLLTLGYPGVKFVTDVLLG